MRDGEAIPMEERTEHCCVNAWWVIGRQILCDVHLKEACALLDIDWDGVVEEVGGLNTEEQKPWTERHRYPQDDPAITQTIGGD